MRVELTDAFIRALPPPPRGRTEIRDKHTEGLVLRITHTGNISWSVRGLIRKGTDAGKHTRASFGTWPEVSLKQARAHARKALGQIADGSDPVAERRAAEAARRARVEAPTVSSRLAEWRKAKTTDRDKPWSSRYAAEIERLCSKIIEPVLGKRVLAETTRSDWVAMIARERTKRPATATWLFSIANAFLNHAEAHGWIPAHLLPRKGLSVIAPKGAPRQRILTDSELVAVWHAAGKLTHKPCAFTRLLVLTGARVSEVAGITKGELDLPSARWTIPAARAKNGQSITLPLNPLALAELKAVAPPDGAGAAYRLLGAVKGGALQGISAVKRQLDKHSGITGWTMHDIRRTVRTGMSRLGVSNDHAEYALNHIGHRSRLEQTYDRYGYEAEVVTALATWQRHVAVLVAGVAPEPKRQPAKVVPLHAA